MSWQLVKKIFSLVAFIGISFTSIQAKGQELDLEDFSSTLEVLRPGYGTTDALEVRFTLANNSENKTLNVLKWHTPFEDFKSDMFYIERDGKRIAYVGRLVKRGLPRIEDYVAVEPGETLSTTVDLSQAYNIHEGGDYSVQFKSRLFGLGIEKSSKLLERGKFLSKAIRSNTIKFKLLESRKPPIVLPVIPIPKQTPSFRGCTQEQQTILNSALTLAEEITTSSQMILHNTPQNVRSQREAERYLTWFGAFDKSRYDKVTRNFEKIANPIANKTITFDCSCSEHIYAYVYAAKEWDIYICNHFWKAPLRGTDSQAGTIVHETSHFTKAANTTDNAYGHYESMQLALESPSLAIENADSHEYFAENTPRLIMPSPFSWLAPVEFLLLGN